jgi:hypothetical protein
LPAGPRIKFAPPTCGAFRVAGRNDINLPLASGHRDIAMTNALRRFVLVVAASLLLLPPSGLAQDSALHVDREYRFAVIFPGEPMARDISYTTRAGTAVAARQFFIEGDASRYLVTVVQFPEGRPQDRRAVEHAAEGLRRRGDVRFQAYANYDPGIPGRQLNIMETNGRQLRASVYMYDRRLFITEASAPPGDFAALQFEQSIMLLDEAGNDVDRSVLAFIGDIFRNILPD